MLIILFKPYHDHPACTCDLQGRNTRIYNCMQEFTSYFIYQCKAPSYWFVISIHKLYFIRRTPEPIAKITNYISSICLPVINYPNIITNTKIIHILTNSRAYTNQIQICTNQDLLRTAKSYFCRNSFSRSSLHFLLERTQQKPLVPCSKLDVSDTILSILESNESIGCAYCATRSHNYDDTDGSERPCHARECNRRVFPYKVRPLQLR